MIPQSILESTNNAPNLLGLAHRTRQTNPIHNIILYFKIVFIIQQPGAEFSEPGWRFTKN